MKFLYAVEPNAGHRALVEMESRIAEFILLTQNVDGLHRRAGSQRVLELHGNLFRVKCFDDNRGVERWPDSPEVPPRCPHCGGLLRPDVVWFGESLPEDGLQSANQAAARADLFLSIGTSALVYPAANLSFVVFSVGVTAVEINLRPTPLSPYVTYSLNGPAGVILPRRVEQAWGVHLLRIR